MSIKSFQDLDVWRKANTVVLRIYRLTDSFPKDQRFGLISQMQRSAVSICANIAEGQKKGTKEYARFVDIAEGSLEETKYYLILAKDLGYCCPDEYKDLFELTNEIGRMLHSLGTNLKANIP